MNQDTLNILINTAKIYLESGLEKDPEKISTIENAIEEAENYDKVQRCKLEEAFRKGHSHTFCSMGFSRDDNPYPPSTPEGKKWIEGYECGIYET